MKNIFFSKPVLKPAAAFIAAVFFSQNILFAHAAEKSLWDQRRAAAKAAQQSDDAASEAPSASAKSPALLLAALPKVGSGLSLPFSNHALNDLGVSPALQLSKKSARVAQIIPDWLQTSVAPYAAIQAVSLSGNPSAKTVLVLQDAHMHYEAQTNIAGVIDALGRALDGRESRLLVGMESLDQRNVDFSSYNAYPYRTIQRSVADGLLKLNILKGTEFAAVGFLGDGRDRPVSPPFVFTGVDDKTEYDANVQSLRDAVPLKPRAKAALSDFSRELTDIKKKNFTPDLIAFDAKNGAFQEGTLGVPEYVSYLDSIVSVESPNLKQLMSAALLERVIKFDKVERERAAMLGILIDRMSQDETKALLQLSTLFRSGLVSYAAYYDHLKTLAASHGVRFEAYPEMSLYVQYVLKTEAIDHEALFDELKAQESAVQKKLISTPAQRETAALTSDLHLLEKLSQHALIEDEWHAYEARRADIQNIGARLASLGGRMPASLEKIQPSWTVFENFYRHALNRNALMAGHLADRLSADQTTVAVLVAGGFHTQGLVKNLKDRGFTVLTLSPKITQVGEGPSSLDFLAANQTPLDKLFAGEKVFLDVPSAIGDPAEAPRTAFLVNGLSEALRRIIAGETGNMTLAVGRFGMEFSEKYFEGSTEVSFGDTTFFVKLKAETSGASLAAFNGSPFPLIAAALGGPLIGLAPRARSEFWMRQIQQINVGIQQIVRSIVKDGRANVDLSELNSGATPFIEWWASFTGQREHLISTDLSSQSNLPAKVMQLIGMNDPANFDTIVVLLGRIFARLEKYTNGAVAVDQLLRGIAGIDTGKRDTTFEDFYKEDMRAFAEALNYYRPVVLHLIKADNKGEILKSAQSNHAFARSLDGGGIAIEVTNVFLSSYMSGDRMRKIREAIKERVQSGKINVGRELAVLTRKNVSGDDQIPYLAEAHLMRVLQAHEMVEAIFRQGRSGYGEDQEIFSKKWVHQKLGDMGLGLDEKGNMPATYLTTEELIAKLSDWIASNPEIVDDNGEKWKAFTSDIVKEAPRWKRSVAAARPPTVVAHAGESGIAPGMVRTPVGAVPASRAATAPVATHKGGNQWRVSSSFGASFRDRTKAMLRVSVDNTSILIGPDGDSQTFFSEGWQITAVAQSPDGERIAFGTENADVYIFTREGATGKYKQTGKRISHDAGSVSKDEIRALAFSSDGKTLVSAGGNLKAKGEVSGLGRVRVWNVEKGNKIAETPPGAQYKTTSVVFSPQGNAIAIGTSDGLVYEFTVNPAVTALETLVPTTMRGDSAHGGKRVNAVAFDNTGTFIISGGADNAVSICLTGTHEPAGRVIYPGEVQAVAVDADGNLAVGTTGPQQNGAYGIFIESVREIVKLRIDVPFMPTPVFTAEGGVRTLVVDPASGIFTANTNKRQIVLLRPTASTSRITGTRMLAFLGVGAALLGGLLINNIAGASMGGELKLLLALLGLFAFVEEFAHFLQAYNEGTLAPLRWSLNWGARKITLGVLTIELIAFPGTSWRIIPQLGIRLSSNATTDQIMRNRRAGNLAPFLLTLYVLGTVAVFKLFMTHTSLLSALVMFVVPMVVAFVLGFVNDEARSWWRYMRYGDSIDKIEAVTKALSPPRSSASKGMSLRDVLSSAVQLQASNLVRGAQRRDGTVLEANMAFAKNPDGDGEFGIAVRVNGKEWIGTFLNGSGEGYKRRLLSNDALDVEGTSFFSWDRDTFSLVGITTAETEDSELLDAGADIAGASVQSQNEIVDALVLYKHSLSRLQNEKSKTAAADLAKARGRAVNLFSLMDKRSKELMGIASPDEAAPSIVVTEDRAIFVLIDGQWRGLDPMGNPRSASYDALTAKPGDRAFYFNAVRNEILEIIPDGSRPKFAAAPRPSIADVLRYVYTGVIASPFSLAKARVIVYALGFSVAAVMTGALLWRDGSSVVWFGGALYAGLALAGAYLALKAGLEADPTRRLMSAADPENLESPLEPEAGDAFFWFSAYFNSDSADALTTVDQQEMGIDSMEKATRLFLMLARYSLKDQQKARVILNAASWTGPAAVGARFVILKDLFSNTLAKKKAFDTLLNDRRLVDSERNILSALVLILRSPQIENLKIDAERIEKALALIESTSAGVETNPAGSSPVRAPRVGSEKSTQRSAGQTDGKPNLTSVYSFYKALKKNQSSPSATYSANNEDEAQAFFLAVARLVVENQNDSSKSSLAPRALERLSLPDDFSKRAQGRLDVMKGLLNELIDPKKSINDAHDVIESKIVFLTPVNEAILMAAYLIMHSGRGRNSADVGLTPRATARTARLASALSLSFWAAAGIRRTIQKFIDEKLPLVVIDKLDVAEKQARQDWLAMAGRIAIDSNKALADLWAYQNNAAQNNSLHIEGMSFAISRLLSPAASSGDALTLLGQLAETDSLKWARQDGQRKFVKISLADKLTLVSVYLVARGDAGLTDDKLESGSTLRILRDQARVLGLGKRSAPAVSPAAVPTLSNQKNEVDTPSPQADETQRAVPPVKTPAPARPAKAPQPPAPPAPARRPVRVPQSAVQRALANFDETIRTFRVAEKAGTLNDSLKRQRPIKISTPDELNAILLAIAQQKSSRNASDDVTRALLNYVFEGMSKSPLFLDSYVPASAALLQTIPTFEALYRSPIFVDSKASRTTKVYLITFFLLRHQENKGIMRSAYEMTNKDDASGTDRLVKDALDLKFTQATGETSTLGSILEPALRGSVLREPARIPRRRVLAAAGVGQITDARWYSMRVLVFTTMAATGVFFGLLPAVILGIVLFVVRDGAKEAEERTHVIVARGLGLDAERTSDRNVDYAGDSRLFPLANLAGPLLFVLVGVIASAAIFGLGALLSSAGFLDGSVSSQAFSATALIVGAIFTTTGLFNGEFLGSAREIARTYRELPAAIRMSRARKNASVPSTGSSARSSRSRVNDLTDEQIRNEALFPVGEILRDQFSNPNAPHERFQINYTPDDVVEFDADGRMLTSWPDVKGKVQEPSPLDSLYEFSRDEKLTLFEGTFAEAIEAEREQAPGALVLVDRSATPSQILKMVQKILVENAGKAATLLSDMPSKEQFLQFMAQAAQKGNAATKRDATTLLSLLGSKVTVYGLDGYNEETAAIEKGFVSAAAVEHLFAQLKIDRAKISALLVLTDRPLTVEDTSGLVIRLLRAVEAVKIRSIDVEGKTRLEKETIDIIFEQA